MRYSVYETTYIDDGDLENGPHLTENEVRHIHSFSSLKAAQTYIELRAKNHPGTLSIVEDKS